MTRFVMYLIISIASGIGSYIPIWLGQSALGGWSILGGFAGGLAGVFIYYKLRQSGYVE